MLMNPGQWSLTSLKEACHLLGVSQDGNRSMLIGNMIDFLTIDTPRKKIRTSSSSRSKIEDEGRLPENDSDKKRKTHVSDDESVSEDESEGYSVTRSRRKLVPSSTTAEVSPFKIDSAAEAAENWLMTNEPVSAYMLGQVVDNSNQSEEIILVVSGSNQSEDVNNDEGEDEECDYDSLCIMSATTS